MVEPDVGPSVTGGRIQRSPLTLSVPIAVAVVIVDQITKRWALANLTPGSCSQPDACIDLVAGLKFHLVFNTGAAFTSGEGYGPVLGVLAFVMAGVLLYLSTRRTSRLAIGLFGAVAGGAVGNLIDRAYRATDGFLSGSVVDFIDAGWWPVFNIADSAIVIGVIGIIVLSMFDGPDDEAAPDPATEPADDSHPDADDASAAVADDTATPENTEEE